MVIGKLWDYHPMSSNSARVIGDTTAWYRCIEYKADPTARSLSRRSQCERRNMHHVCSVQSRRDGSQIGG